MICHLGVCALEENAFSASAAEWRLVGGAMRGLGPRGGNCHVKVEDLREEQAGP